MSSLLEKLLKNTSSKHTSVLTKSKVYSNKPCITTVIPMINVALGGELDGGLPPGILTIAGPSRHFKTGYALIMIEAFQKKYPNGYCLFYDSEFGTPPAYFENFGVDMDRIIHTPVTDVEELKFDITKQINSIEKGDEFMIVIDSIGNLASKKEVDDAIEQKSVADMSRAKQIKSLFRIVTPHLNLKNIPLVVINHTYKTQEMYSKDVISGGTGVLYSSDAAWIIGRQQEKDGTEIVGYNFVINIEKSRHVKEKSKIPISITHKGGIDKWSGMFDLALEAGMLIKPKMGWYQKVDLETGEISQESFREKAIKADVSYFEDLLKNKKFAEFVRQKYKLSAPTISNDPEVVYNDEDGDE